LAVAAGSTVIRRLLALGLTGLGWSGAIAPGLAQSAAEAPVDRPELRGGSQGAVVRELQAALQLLGFYAGPIDGLYAEATIVAVSRFQAAAGLPMSGIVDRATWNRLFPPVPGAIASPPPATPGNPAASKPTPAAVEEAAPPILRLGAQGEAVRRLQERLRARGFLEGAVDGIFGPATLAAVEAAQAALGLAVDGAVGPATWEALLAE